MTWDDKGGAAFPITHSNEPGAPYAEHGMSLRDWFAGQAMAVLANPTHEVPMGADKMKLTARGLYLLADAMLAERNKEPTK